MYVLDCLSKTEYAGGNLTPEPEARTEALQCAVEDQFARFKRTLERLIANGGVVCNHSSNLSL